MLWGNVHPMMALKGDKSSTIENHMFWVIGPAYTGNTTSPKEFVEAPLNPDSIHLGFSRVDGRSPICLYANIYKRLVELPGLIKTLLTSNPLIPSIRIRASLYGCRTQLGFIGGKVVIPSTRCALPPDKLCWMELTCSLIEATQSLPFSFGIVFLVNEASVNVFDDNSKSYWSYGTLGGQILGCFPLSSGCVDILF